MASNSPEQTGNTGRTLRRYRFLLRYAGSRRAGWALIVLVTLLGIAFGLLQPWPMKVLVDHVLGHEPMPPAVATVVQFLPGAGSPGGLLAWVVFSSLLVFAIDNILDVIQTIAWIRVGERMIYDLSRDMFARIQRRSMIFHTRNQVGDSMSRITEDNWCVYTVVDTLLFTPVFTLITLVGMLGLMWRMDPSLTLVSLAVAPFMAGASMAFGKPVRKAAQANREIASQLQSHIQQTLSGIPVVQAFTREEREHRRFQEFTSQALRAQRWSTLVGSFSGLTAGLITTVGAGVVLWIGGRNVLHGGLTVGSLLVFLSYLGSLQAQLGALAGIYTTLQGTGASIDRVMEVMEAEPEVKDGPGARPLSMPNGHVRLENVTFGYEPDRTVLEHVSLEARPGEMLALVGKTGAGKSTLVSLIPRFFDPWEGRVTLDGVDVRDLQLKSLREQVAIVLQEPFLLPFTIAENIAYGRPGAPREEIEAAARAANAHAFIERLPQGYDTVIGERGTTLSGGERQRIAIARALLKDAPILILDEPTSALDAETEALLFGALDRLMKGRTTFIIAHRLSTVHRANRIVVIEDGKVVETGTHTDLLATDGAYRRLHSYYDVAYKRENVEEEVAA
jgi:ABC-type multidrug transport system fused ATPase/permease subunit